MKKYFIKKGEYYNEYNLFYTDCQADEKLLPKGCEQIARTEAITKCIEENTRRKSDPNFSGYADCHIFPVVNREKIDFENNPNYELIDYIWEVKY